MKQNDFSFRVRYGETDQMGIVYHGNYLAYLELGRIEWLRQYGVTYREMEEDGILLPVVNLKINYRKPAYYDDLLTIRTELVRLPTVRIEFDYQIFNEDQELLVEANTVLAFIDKMHKKPMKCPTYLLEKFF